MVEDWEEHDMKLSIGLPWSSAEDGRTQIRPQKKRSHCILASSHVLHNGAMRALALRHHVFSLNELLFRYLVFLFNRQLLCAFSKQR
jgi:hypothetical protein